MLFYVAHVFTGTSHYILMKANKSHFVLIPAPLDISLNVNVPLDLIPVLNLEASVDIDSLSSDWSRAFTAKRQRQS